MNVYFKKHRKAQLRLSWFNIVILRQYSEEAERAATGFNAWEDIKTVAYVAAVGPKLLDQLELCGFSLRVHLSST